MYVITCNDSVMAVVPTDDEASAERVKARMQAEDDASYLKDYGHPRHRAMHWAARLTRVVEA